MCPNGHCAGPYRIGEYGPVGETCFMSGTLSKDHARSRAATANHTCRPDVNGTDPPRLNDSELEAAYGTWRTYYEGLEGGLYSALD